MPSRSNMQRHGRPAPLHAIAGASGLTFVLLGGLLSGCEEEVRGDVPGDRDRGVTGVPRTREEDPGPPLVANGPSKEVLQRVGEASCARRQRCGEIGDRVDACVERLKMDLVSEINNQSCRAVDRAGLDRCIASVETEGCGDPWGALQRAIACRQAALCTELPDDERR